MVVPLNIANVTVASRLADPIPAAAAPAAANNRAFDDALRSARYHAAPSADSVTPHTKPAPAPSQPAAAAAPPAKASAESTDSASANGPDVSAAQTEAAPTAQSEAGSTDAEASTTSDDHSDQSSTSAEENVAVDDETDAAVTDAATISAAAVGAAAEIVAIQPAPEPSVVAVAETLVVATVEKKPAKTDKPTHGKQSVQPSEAPAAKVAAAKVAPEDTAPTVEPQAKATTDAVVTPVTIATEAQTEAPVVADALPEEITAAVETKKSDAKTAVSEASPTVTPAAPDAVKPAAAAQAVVAEPINQPSLPTAEVADDARQETKRQERTNTDHDKIAKAAANQATQAADAPAPDAADATAATANVVEAAALDATVESASFDGASQPAADASPASGSAPNTPAALTPTSESPRAVVHHLRHVDVTAQTTNLNEAERLRLIQRVSKALQTAGDGGVMRLRLTPPELGAVRMEIKVRDGVMQAHLTAETETARAVLLENVPALRDRLAEQSIRLERFDVDLSDTPSGGLTQQSGDQRQPYETGDNGLARGNAQRRGAAAAAVASPAPVASRIFDGRGGLNVVI